MLRDVAKNERPREKAMLYGLETLSDVELLAILINSGSQGESVLSLSTRFLEMIGGIGNINSSLLSLKIKGLGKAKLLHILAGLELGQRVIMRQNLDRPIVEPQEFYDRFAMDLVKYSYEVILCIYLDDNRKLLGKRLLGHGSKSTCLVDKKEILKEAISLSSSKVVIMHNHPFGRHIPSKEDDMSTSLISDYMRLFNVELTDHLIVSKDGYYAYSKENPSLLSPIRQFLTK